MKRLIQDQDGVYMIDEACLKKTEQIEREKEIRWQQKARNKQMMKQNYKRKERL